MAFIKKLGNLFVPEKGNKKSICLNILQRNVNPADIWAIEFELGDGSFGKVYRAVNKESGVHAALKEVPIESDEDLEDHMVELSILNECKHKNLVSLFEAYLYDEKIMMLLEYCGGGAVDNIMIELDKPLTEPQIRHTCHEICEGLAFLHKSCVIHRDIKAGNVLLTLNGMVKLADFGVSTKDSRPGSKHTTFIGTPYWMAPEVAICDAVKDEPYDYRADIWSLGVTLIELAQMQPPHHEMSPMRVIMRIIKSDPPTLEKPNAWSAEFVDFLKRCLVKSPEERWPATDLLKHPFICDATDPQPLLLLLAEFRADVSETQEEVTDPDIIKRYSRHEGIFGREDSRPDHCDSIGDVLSPNTTKANVPERQQSRSPEKPATPASLPINGKLSSASPSPSPDVADTDNVVLEGVVDKIVVDVISDDLNSPSVPDCVAAAISEYVGEQYSKVQKTPASSTSTTGSTSTKSKPETKSDGVSLKSAEVTTTPQRRLPRSTIAAAPAQQASNEHRPTSSESKLPSEGTDLETNLKSPEPKRLSVSEMAKILSVKLGHSSEGESSTATTNAPAKEELSATVPVVGGLPRSSVTNRTTSPAAQAIYVDTVEISGEAPKKVPPPLPPRNTSLPLQDMSFSPSPVVSNGNGFISNGVSDRVPPQELARSFDTSESAGQHEGRDSIERSASRYRTLVRTRRFEFGGKTVTTSTSHLIVTGEGGRATVVDKSKAFARERRRHLRELKLLQRSENKAYQEMLTKSNLELDQQAKRIEAEREAIISRYENEEELLRQQQKQNLEAVERLQAKEMKALVKRLNEQQEREFKTLRENGKDELKALEREIGRLPKDLRKQTLRIKTTMKQDELARRESEFAKRQEEKMQLEKRALAESHRGDLLRLEQQFLEQQQHIRRKQEGEMATLEERQIHEKHALSQRHILTAYKLKQQQMSTRHMRELARIRAEADHTVSELRHSQAVELKLVPRKIREESKVRLQMYKEKLRIENKKNGISDMRLGFMSLVGDGTATMHREKIREFEMEEKRRKEEYQDRVERRHKLAVAKLEHENESRIKDTESAHQEALRQLADAEATKLNELDREFQEELLRCHNTHLSAQAELEQRFKEELEDQRRFYHVPLSSSSSSPNSVAAPVGVSVRSSKSSYGFTGYSNDDSLSTGTASSSENHQRMYHHNGNGVSSGLPRTTLVSDYEMALAARRAADGMTASMSMQQSLALERHTQYDGNGGNAGPKTHAIFTSEML